MRDALRRVGPADRPGRRGLYLFRHTLATQLLAAGQPLKAIADVLGHASTQTTYGYYELHRTTPHRLPASGSRRITVSWSLRGRNRPGGADSEARFSSAALVPRRRCCSCRFLSRQRNKPITGLDLTDLDPPAILAFLSHLEQERKLLSPTRECGGGRSGSGNRLEIPPGRCHSPSQPAAKVNILGKSCGVSEWGSTQPRHQPVRPILARSARLMRG
jgi:hypothetical protein